MAHGGHDSDSELYRQRHSASHLLAEAVLQLFPQAQLGIGPPTDDGFYYDFELPRPLTADDLEDLEQRMRALIAADQPFTYRELGADEARELFADQLYKLELIEAMTSGGLDDNANQTSGPVVISTYRHGSFEDLCRGPHVERAGAIGPKTFRLLRTSSAYWRGDEHRPVLQRVYGTLWITPEELDAHLWRLEEAKKRDHRKLGEELELFTFSPEIGRGLPLWLPKGTVICDELETWARETERAHGYQRVATPHITKSELYYISGHLPYYQDDMYAPMQIDDEDYYLKPMNCPHHHMIYKARPRSYRELPLRLAEYGTVYRYEKSGQLYGMMRARAFTQNDAHIYCTLEQAKDEFLAVMRLHDYYYRKLGVDDFFMVLALRDPNNTDKYHGDEQMWQTAERLTREAMEESGIPYIEDIGAAAHYGPKVDFIIRSVTGREFAASTNQLDLYMPDRFDLTYTNSAGQQDHVAVIHRAPLGSHERFVAFLIEHFAGAFPAWLAPVQVALVPITNHQHTYAWDIARRLEAARFRVEVDDSDERMQQRIRKATLSKIPFILVLGRREAEAGTVAVRLRDGTDLGTQPIAEFVTRLTHLVKTRSLPQTSDG